MSNGLIDLARIPTPDAVQVVSHGDMVTAFLERFAAVWAEERVKDPTLPQYDVGSIVADPASLTARVDAFFRMKDLGRVNDAVRAVLAPSAKRADLDNVVARQGIQRLVLRPATQSDPAVMEDDASLLNRYYLSFQRGSAGSADRYLVEAYTAWPFMHDAKVNGHAVHGRKGDIDIVVAGPGGRDATDAELAIVRSACRAPDVWPEGVDVAVRRAVRIEYSARFVIEIPNGPDPSLVVAEAEARIAAAAAERMFIGQEVPESFLKGAGYGPSIIAVRETSTVAIAADPYAIPVMTELLVTVEVRS